MAQSIPHLTLHKDRHRPGLRRLFALTLHQCRSVYGEVIAIFAYRYAPFLIWRGNATQSPRRFGTWSCRWRPDSLRRLVLGSQLPLAPPPPKLPPPLRPSAGLLARGQDRPGKYRPWPEKVKRPSSGSCQGLNFVSSAAAASATRRPVRKYTSHADAKAASMMEAAHSNRNPTSQSKTNQIGSHKLAGLLAGDPAVDLLFEDREREGTGHQDLGMEFANVELIPKLRLGLLA